MGGSSSKGSEKAANTMAASGDDAPVGEVQIFKLAVSSGSCSGVFWRGDPRTGARPPDNSDWPRNGALLKGVLHSVKGKQHLEVLEQVPAGGTAWQPVSAGKWMPSDGGRSNGGKWLHPPDRDVTAAPADEPERSCPRPGALAST